MKGKSAEENCFELEHVSLDVAAVARIQVRARCAHCQMLRSQALACARSR